ncbi:MAG: UDP-N-acetylglucosamine 2-epimerase (non-hydrolyzing) [Candidatus Pacebacteria bacterium]|nr:UDP-N-acetylglucosamine 2-epimerase (non-hydrolyzing) [Candidatus Paceibacterota bacterium]
MKILTILGTRPEIIRLSLIIKELDRINIKNIIVHTGQNYDSKLSDIFFKDLDLRKPDYYLGIKEDKVGAQIGKIIEKAEEIILKEKPDLLLILGDTNSALSAISAARHSVPILHLEAGNRCFDWRVPEEKNRVIIDHISNWLVPYTERSKENLIKEGISSEFIFVSGNPIREVLEYFKDKIEESNVLNKLKMKEKDYFLITAHREENVDDPDILSVIIKGLNLIAEKFKKDLIFSVHPRTKFKLSKSKIKLSKNIKVSEPFGFFDFVKLEKNALAVITDSGTVQEECSILKTPTVTIRETTERPETVECGSNILSGTSDSEKIFETVNQMLKLNNDWISPYENDLNVSNKIIKFILHQKPKK